MVDVSIVVRNIEHSGAFLFALPHPLTHRLPHRQLLGAPPDFLAPPRHPHSRRHHGHPRNVTLASTTYPATKAIWAVRTKKRDSPLSTVPGRDLAHALATWLAPAVTQAPVDVDLTDAPGIGL